MSDGKCGTDTLQLNSDEGWKRQKLTYVMPFGITQVFLSQKPSVVSFSHFMVKTFFVRRKNPVLKEVIISWIEIS